MKLRYITAIHGNEPAPVLALASLGIPQTIANPLALRKKVRYVDKDMNASFGLSGDGYEIKQARKILQLIKKDEFVVDLHTFTGQSPPFVIVVDKQLLTFAAGLGIKHIVFMDFNPKAGHALINHRKGVSIETGQHQDFEKVFDTINQLVSCLTNKKRGDHDACLYKVVGAYDTPGRYVNFKTRSDGHVPILASPKAHQIHGWYALRAINLILKK
ncbi:MAG: hypothetical protein GXP43_00935 [bacterium]|nr:hypothetical protein [bacterium]